MCTGKGLSQNTLSVSEQPSSLYVSAAARRGRDVGIPPYGARRGEGIPPNISMYFQFICCDACRAGKRSMKQLPAPGADSTEISPPSSLA